MRSKVFYGSAAITATVAALFASQAAFADTSEVGFTIQGRVSTICRAEFISANAQSIGDEVDLGGISELCNNEEGYVVTLTHSPDLAGKTLLFDNRNIVLSAGGETVVYESNDADVREHHLALLTDQDPSGFNLGVRIMPRGQIF